MSGENGPGPPVEPPRQSGTARGVAAGIMGLSAAIIFLSGSQYFIMPGPMGNGIALWSSAAGLAAVAWAVRPRGGG